MGECCSKKPKGSEKSIGSEKPKPIYQKALAAPSQNANSKPNNSKGHGHHPQKKQI